MTIFVGKINLVIYFGNLQLIGFFFSDYLYKCIALNRNLEKELVGQVCVLHKYEVWTARCPPADRDNVWKTTLLRCLTQFPATVNVAATDKKCDYEQWP